MKTNNWEDWAMGLSFAAAVGATVFFTQAGGPSFATAAIAAEQPAYVMTITAKRLPSECKGLSGKTAPAHCAALIDAQTVEVRALN